MGCFLLAQLINDLLSADSSMASRSSLGRSCLLLAVVLGLLLVRGQEEGLEEGLEGVMVPGRSKELLAPKLISPRFFRTVPSHLTGQSKKKDVIARNKITELFKVMIRKERDIVDSVDLVGCKEMVEIGQKEEAKKKKLLSIANQIRGNPEMVYVFKDEVLQEVVSYPASLALVPLPVLGMLVSDPQFGWRISRRVKKSILEMFVNVLKQDDEDTWDYLVEEKHTREHTILDEQLLEEPAVLHELSPVIQDLVLKPSSLAMLPLPVLGVLVSQDRQQLPKHLQEDISQVFRLAAAEGSFEAYITEIPVEDGEVESVEASSRLASIASHIRADPRIVADFRPSVLRSLVSNPASLPLLPLPVLDQLISDPIFRVELPEAALEGISQLFMAAMEKEKMMELAKNKTDGGESSDTEDYEDYDYAELDYGDPDEAIEDFLRDLDPEFLRTISPEVLVAYFESAKPEDIKNILADSQILLNLPAATIGAVFKKLPESLIVTVVNSAGVKELFTETARVLSVEERQKMEVWQQSVASELIRSLNVSVLVQLPEFLIRSQLSNSAAVSSLVEQPAKLEALLERHPQLLEEVPPAVLENLLGDRPGLLEQLPGSLVSSLLTCPLISQLASLPPHLSPPWRHSCLAHCPRP